MVGCSGFKCCAPPHFQLVDFPFSGPEAPQPGLMISRLRLPLVEVIRGFVLFRRGRHAGFRFLVRCAIDISPYQRCLLERARVSGL